MSTSMMMDSAISSSSQYHHLTQQHCLKNSSVTNSNTSTGSLAMRYLATTGHHHPSSNTTSYKTTSKLNYRIENSSISNPVTTASTPFDPTSSKLEARVLSPCTGDLAVKTESTAGITQIPSPGNNLSVYFTDSIARSSNKQQHVLVNNNAQNRNGSMNSDIQITFKKCNDEAAAAAAASEYQFQQDQTILLNSKKGVNSPSPPPALLSNSGATNPHFYSEAAQSLINGLKRRHDEAFFTTGTSNSMPSSTNSPSPPPLMSNGYNNHSQTILPNGGSIASPSSTYSEFGKEDMSPSNSVNGYMNVDNLGNDPKKKKGPAPRQQEELCLVCGDRASGYHYNALTCEGCKGFFRRSITKNAVYQCKYGNSCEIDMYMRRKCQECRLKKCLSVGMRPECVVPEYQCAIKREAKRAIKEKDKPNSTTKDSLSPDDRVIHSQMVGPTTTTVTPTAPISVGVEKKPLAPLQPSSWSNNNSNDLCTLTQTPLATTLTKKLITSEQEEVIQKLVFYQEEFESPSDEDVKKIAPFPNGENAEDDVKRFQHVAEMTILTVQLIVEFSKRVPLFDSLYREDQITLLKACSSEVMMLRCSRRYDIRTDSIVYANNQPYTRDNYTSASISYTTEPLFNFCQRMCMLKVDNAEYALITTIVIFSDRPSLIQREKVEKIQEHYIETLRAYVESNRPNNRCHFAKLLGILTELRTLGYVNSEMCVSLKIQNKKLPPFLAEIWDIQE